MNCFCRLLLAATLSLASLCSIAQQSPGSAGAAKPAPMTAASASSNVPSEATVNDFLKKMFGWNQQLTWKIASIKPAEDPSLTEIVILFNTPQGQQLARIYVTPGQKFALSGDLVPFGADPFAADREILKGVNGPMQGPKDATVTIVEFGDLECPACKAAQPKIAKLMQDEPKAQLIFQNFPLEQLHKWALLGAKYVDCIGRENNAAVWKFIATVYDHQGEITEQTAAQALPSYAKDAGADPAVVAACIALPETEKRVRDSLALGEKLSVTSTPTFFVEGRKIANFVNTPDDVIKSMVDYDINNPAK